MKRIFGLICMVGLLVCSCGNEEEKLFIMVDPGITNIHFKNLLKDTPGFNILTYLYFYNGAGVAAGDFNADGLVDLYFTSNMGNDHLYINEGNLRFSEVGSEANIRNGDGWTTGVTHVDINSDGLLDLYICKLGDYGGIQGKNLLFVNQGVNENGIPTFREAAAEYGLDFSGFATQASFFDYDLDGDLDMFLLNHSVHPNRTYGKGVQRTETDSISGDKLYRNDNGFYNNVSAQAGIFQGKIGYGLGLAVSDVNNDGYPDMYVGNDFFENDYLYINQGDGSFREMITEDQTYLGHTTHFSMGNDIADINNDGLMDIISLDMLPEELETYKTSGFEYSYPIYEYYLKNGYRPQYMQNTLHLNMGNGRFSEIGNMAGVSATEWSWGPLAADFDNDGDKDMYIANGIKGATNDMDFINFIADDNIQKSISSGLTESDMKFISEIPEKKVSNYFFENTGGLQFSDVTAQWFEKRPSFSNGCVAADLDNDGDLDIVVNNLDEPAFILENKGSELNKNNHLSIRFRGSGGNSQGIGARILAYTDGEVQSMENYVSRGYLSAVPSSIHLGIGTKSSIDSLLVIWPSGTFQRLGSLKANTQLVLKESASGGNYYSDGRKNRDESFLINVDTPLDFVHREGGSLDFNRDPLLPFANTNEGPGLAIGDVNMDGLDDIVFGGAKFQATALYLQDEYGVFNPTQNGLFEKDAVCEDVSQLIADLNGDSAPDLLVVSGGNEFESGVALEPRLYINKQGVFEKDSTQFSGLAINASKVSAVDFDKDGDLDILIAADQVPLAFGLSPRHYLFENDGNANFTDITETTFGEATRFGNAKDLLWTDLDGNGFDDLVVVGHWMPVTVFLNDGKRLKLQENNGLSQSRGWWNAILAEDFDRDGDIDLIIGNWGLNSRLTASAAEPITLYRYDFNSNGRKDPLLTYFYQGTETPLASKDELVKQMPFLNKDFLSYKRFAQARIEELFSKEKLSKADKKQVFELETSYFINNGRGKFTKHELPQICQASTIQDIVCYDFNNDGYPDILMAGNNYEISTQLGRMDALHGLILLNDKMGGFQWARNQNFSIPGPAREIEYVRIEDQEYYCIAINNNSPVFLRVQSTK
jgi:enediyne biosynthesis protein E4